VLIIPSFLLAIERAPRISDREIVERLTRLEEGQKNLMTLTVVSMTFVLR